MLPESSNFTTANSMEFSRLNIVSDKFFFFFFVLDINYSSGA